MAEDTRQPGEEKKSEPTRTGQRAAAHDDLDIDIDSAPVKIQRSGGGLVWLVFAVIVVLGVAAYFGYKYYETWRAEKEAEALAQRIETYEAQMTTIANNISQAAASARAGNLDEALDQLNAADGKLKELGAAANSNNDQQWAAIAQKKRDAVIEAQKALEGYRTTVEDQFGSLETVFGIKAESAPAESAEPVEGAESTEATEDAETGAAVEPEQPAAGAESPEAGAAEPVPPVAPEAGAAEGGTAEQPVTDDAAIEEPAPAPAPGA